jgi:hypothetical protein
VLVGTAGSILPSIQSVPNAPLTVSDGDLLWATIGTSFDRSRLVEWHPLTTFKIGDVVQAQSKQYYQMTRYIGGVSGGDAAKFQITRYCTIIDPLVKIKEVTPGTLTWQDMGTLRPRQSPDCSEFAMDYGRDAKAFATWENLHAIAAKLEPGSKLELTSDAAIYEPGVEGGRYYKPISTGDLGPISPFTNITPPMVITWLDSGTTPPASISSGQPADQTVSLINLTLPQTHTLARFNISAGAGFVLHDRPPTFGWVLPSSAGVNLPTPGVGVSTSSGPVTAYFVPARAITTGSNQAPIATTVPTTGSSASTVSVEPQSQCTYNISPVQDTSPFAANKNVAAASATSPVWVLPVYECPIKTGSGTRPVDAVLAVTAYIFPVDEEVPWRWKFWAPGAWRDWMPAPSFGMSLTNPTSSFYLGGSNEFGVRNLQIFYGLSLLNQQSRLSAYSAQQIWGGQGTPATVATISTIHYGLFIGATFNLSNFVQSIIGGGAK